MRSAETTAAASGAGTKSILLWFAAGAPIVAAAALAWLGLAAGSPEAFAAQHHVVAQHHVGAPHHVATPKVHFTGDAAETQRFLGYFRSIELTKEQEAVRREALEALPAPCCAKFSAATCCCPCNMAKASWGLAKHLIVEQGAAVVEVRAAVSEWYRAINPGGFSGDACFTGGCARPFAENGCGGMKDSELVF
jgi:hypothetical protein